jgi:hypothetical protein
MKPFLLTAMAARRSRKTSRRPPVLRRINSVACAHSETTPNDADLALEGILSREQVERRLAVMLTADVGDDSRRNWGVKFRPTPRRAGFAYAPSGERRCPVRTGCNDRREQIASCDCSRVVLTNVTGMDLIWRKLGR